MLKSSSSVRSRPLEPASPRTAMPDMLHRQPSDTSTAGSHSKKWRMIPMIRKKPSILSKDVKSWATRSNDTDSHDSLGLRADTGSSIIHEASDSSQRQLREIVQRMRTGPTGPKEVDGAYDVYNKHKDRANALCYAILHEEFKPARHASNATENLRRDSSLESPNPLYDQRSSFSGRSLTEIVTGSGGRSTHLNEAGLNTVREWRGQLESLAEWFKINLAETYKKFEPDATPDMMESLFNNKRFRREAVHRMRNASVTRVMSADPQFFPRYEIRFRNYERVKQDLVEIRGLVQAGESGISPDRKIKEIVISPRGDSILEFANIHPESTDSEPVLQFRVTSHMLAETSPIFARIFSSHAKSVYQHDNDDIHDHLPLSTATRYICKDGSEAKLYRMPHFETNNLQCMEILLHGAHLHNENVPREVTFDQFVAIAECCMRYKCTSPLELVVEHRWLPQWMHKGADDMPDGMLAISYAFGLRTLFTRMSKSAILNLVDERDLQSKPWPQKIKDKLWAVRCAKVAQVYACCTSAIQEYIRPPTRNPADDVQPINPSDLRGNHLGTSLPPPAASVLSTTPRCPKGSHWCDAGNLGWMMLVYNELNLLSHILRPSVLTHLPDSAQQPARSLAQIVEALRRVPSPLSPIHRGGVCDPSTSFRAAVNDIFNSVSGLTLHDVSGKSHGWALSKHRETEPQEVITWGLDRMAANDRNHHSVATEFHEHVRLKVLSYIDDLDDLHTAAMINRRWYDTYKTHELYLMRNILRAGRVRSEAGLQQPILPKSISNAEEKVPKDISDEMRATGPEDRGDTLTLPGDVDDDSEFDDGESINGTPAPSITESLWREARMRQVRSQSADQSTNARSPPQAPYTVPPPHPPPPCDVITPPGITTVITSTRPAPRAGSCSGPSKQTHSKPTVTYAEYVSEPPLTDEEARRILWPDADDDAASSSTPTPPSEGLREKFRFGDKSFTDGLEDKSLVVTEDKQLLSEHDRALRHLKRNGGGGGGPRATK